MSANETQVGGTHYKSDLEHWDWSVKLGLPAMDHQVSRYVGRHHKKNGVQDLKKALHHLQKMLELTEAGDLAPWAVGHTYGNTIARALVKDTVRRTRAFVSANHCPPWVGGFMQDLVLREGIEDLRKLITWVELAISEYPPEEKPVAPTDGSAPGPGYVNQD